MRELWYSVTGYGFAGMLLVNAILFGTVFAEKNFADHCYIAALVLCGITSEIRRASKQRAKGD